MHTVARNLSTACLLIAPFVFDLPVRAAEGRIPIPFAPAANPVLIDTPGSYVLTRNLPAIAGSPTIEISIPAPGGDVDLDLNGFVVTGDAGGGPLHSPIVAIVPSGTSPRIRIHDGSIEGGFFSFLGNGPGNFVLERLSARNATSGALELNGASAVVRDCVLEATPAYGIDLGIGQATIERNVIRNAGGGIFVAGASGCLISGNSISAVGPDMGINLLPPTRGCTVAGNVISNCTGSDPSAGISLLASGNAISKNVVSGCPVGIRVTGSFNHLEGNLTSGNGCGLVFALPGSSNVYRGNTSRSNSGGGSSCVSGGGPCGFDFYVNGPPHTSAGDNFVPSGAAPCN